MKKIIRLSLLATVFSVSGLLTSCASSTAGNIGGQARSQLLIAPPEQVNQMALQYFAEQNTAAKKANVLVTSGSQYDRVNKIMRRLIPQTATFRADAPSWPWELVLINDDELNAHVMPGGKVTVYTGLINKLSLTDDEIAAVMGHEMSHALREHTREKISQEQASGLGLQLLGAFVKMPAGSMQALGLAKQLGMDLPNSRGMETEADVYGVELAARAGYDPRAAISLWNKMLATDRNAPPQFLSTHPAGESRIVDLGKTIPNVMPIYSARAVQAPSSKKK